MRNVILAIATTMAACAAQPTTSSTGHQLCTAGDGCSWTVAAVRAAQRDWIREELPGAVLTTDAGCSRFSEPSTGRSGTQCYVSVTYYGYEMVVVCDGYDDGEFTCDTGWD